MKTFAFCTSYAATLGTWEERWGRWLKAIVHGGLSVDKIAIVDDGSPVLPDWPGVDIVPVEAPFRDESHISIYHFSNRLGQGAAGETFPGWYRSFAFAVRHAIRSGFDRIIHIESDAFLISDKAVDLFNTREHGWMALWCPLHGFPESTLQVICRDSFGACEEYFSKPYSAHIDGTGTPIERLLPFTHVEKVLVGDRYGESGPDIPFGADFASQVRWGQPDTYYWWLTEAGLRRTRSEVRPGTGRILAKYERSRAGSISHEGVDYREFLRFLARQTVPRSYFEIGTHQGESLETVSCDAICVDPSFEISRNVIGRRTRTFLFQMTSDDFFKAHDPRDLVGDVDLAFLDGLHLFEALLRDFINFEKHSHPGSLVLLHDCLPLNTRMAGRDHQPGPEEESAATRAFWTGDVWRVIPILRELRPDLQIFYLDCPPTGLVVCGGLDSRSSVLAYNYDKMVGKYSGITLEEFGMERLWSLFPTLSSEHILREPLLFCEAFGFRR